MTVRGTSKIRPVYIAALATLVVVGFTLFAYRAYAVLVGPNAPGTAADDNSVGTITWTNPNNSKVSDTSCTTATISTAAKEKSVKIIQGGVVSGTDKSTGATLAAHSCGATQTFTSYGSSADLWGLSWTATDINASNFGLAYSGGDNTSQSHYLDTTNFGFAIPATATINGILAEVQSSDDSSTGVCGVANCVSVNFVRISVTYTLAPISANVTVGKSTVTVTKGTTLIR